MDDYDEEESAVPSVPPRGQPHGPSRFGVPGAQDYDAEIQPSPHKRSRPTLDSAPPANGADCSAPDLYGAVNAPIGRGPQPGSNSQQPYGFNPASASLAQGGVPQPLPPPPRNFHRVTAPGLQGPGGVAFPGSSALQIRPAALQPPPPPPPPSQAHLPHRHGPEEGFVGGSGSGSHGRGLTGDGADADASPISFKAFLLEQAEDISPAEAQKHYNAYVSDFMKRQPSQFFNEEKNAAWFKERYHPLEVRERQVRIQREVAVRAKEYARIWDTRGPRACFVDLRVGASSENGNDSAAATAVANVEENEHLDAPASFHVAKVEAENQVDGVAEDPSAEVVVNATTELGDGAVATIKNETLMEEKATAGDTAVDAAVIASERKTVSLARKLSSSPVPQEDMLPLQREPVNDTVFLKAIPLSLPRAALEDIMCHGRNGDMDFPLVRFKFGEINPGKGMTRLGWAVYQDEATAKKAIGAVRGARVHASPPYIRPGSANVSKSGGADEGGDGQHEGVASADDFYVVQPTLNVHRKRRFPTGRILPCASATRTRIEHDAAQAEALIRCFDKMRLVDTALQRLTPEFFVSLDSDSERLDFSICYLREVHYFCYYSGNEYLEDPTSMLPSEVRPDVKGSSSSVFNSDAGLRWERKLDDRIKFLLARRHDRPRSEADDGTTLRKEMLTKWLDSQTRFEAEGRYRCLLPPMKLFKGPEFVHKHIRSKNPEAVNEVLKKADEEQFRINFNLDPAKDELLGAFLEYRSLLSTEHDPHVGVLEGGRTVGHHLGVPYPNNAWGKAGMSGGGMEGMPGGLPGGAMPLGPPFGGMPSAMQGGIPGGTPGMQGMMTMPPGLMPMMMPGGRMPGAGMPGQAIPGMPGVGMPGVGMPGVGMPGGGMPGGGMPGGGISVGGLTGGAMPGGVMPGGGLPHGGMPSNGSLPGGVRPGGGVFNAPQMMPPSGEMFNHSQMMMNGPQNFVGSGYSSNNVAAPQPEYNEYGNFPSGSRVDEDEERHGPDIGWSTGRSGDGGGHYRGGRGGRSRSRGRGRSGSERRSREISRSRPLDPRARRPNNNYNDLDAPPAGPRIDAAYDDV